MLTKIQVFEVVRSFRNWRKNYKNCRIKLNCRTAVVTNLCGICLISVILSLSLGGFLENLVLKIAYKN